jgi:hypothetical protein
VGVDRACFRTNRTPAKIAWASYKIPQPRPSIIAYHVLSANLRRIHPSRRHHAIVSRHDDRTLSCGLIVTELSVAASEVQCYLRIRRQLSAGPSRLPGPRRLCPGLGAPPLPCPPSAVTSTAWRRYENTSPLTLLRNALLCTPACALSLSPSRKALYYYRHGPTLPAQPALSP